MGHSVPHPKCFYKPHLQETIPLVLSAIHFNALLVVGSHSLRIKSKILSHSSLRDIFSSKNIISVI